MIDAPLPPSEAVEETTAFLPRFGPDGLIGTIAQHSGTGEVLMFAWMNAEALELTLTTGEAHFWSRSRKSIWRKGATSGELLRVIDILTDCDQDALLLKVEPLGLGAACHTGRRSCFYRAIIPGDGKLRALEFRAAARLFAPEETYRNLKTSGT